MSSTRWRDEERSLLLEGRWLPVTECILFVEADVSRCVEALVHGVRGRHVRELTGCPMVAGEVRGAGLEELLGTLLPLTTSSCRTLLLPTADPRWTAYLTNRIRGLDPHSAMAWFAEAGIRSVSVAASPNIPRLPERRAVAGVRKIEVAVPDPVRGYLGYSVGVQVQESNRWYFVEPSRPFPAGHVWDETARRVPDRFTRAHLDQAAAWFGLRPFDEDFYAPDGRGCLIHEHAPPGTEAGSASMSLAEARGEVPDRRVP